MVTILMAFMLNFMNTPHVTATVPGEYYEMVRSDYDSVNNQTYATFGRYTVEYNGVPHVMMMQFKTFNGQPTKQQMLKTQEVDSYIKVVDLQK